MGTIRNGLECLRRNGWTKGRIRNSRGEVCAVGALRAGNINSESYVPKTLERDMSTLSQVIRELFPDSIRFLLHDPRYLIADIVSFNDLQYTTQEQIELVFEKAAIKQEEIEGL